jgi:DNA (cytosine-5)-methyltransferase 1
VRDLGDVCSTVTSKYGTGGGNVPVTFQPIMTMAHGQAGAEIATDRTPTLTCNHEAPIDFHPTQDPISSANVCHSIGANSNATAAVAVGTDCYNGNLTGDIAATMGTPGSSINASGSTVMVPIAWDEELNASIDQAGTLLRGGDGGRHDGVMVGAFKPGQSAAARSIGYENEMAPSLEAGGGGNNKPAVHIGMQVRRLTPVECERLQGFPDNYTHIKDKCPDGPRYKALGNSWAVPVVRWIGKRIQEHINAP